MKSLFDYFTKWFAITYFISLFFEPLIDLFCLKNHDNSGTQIKISKL